MAEEQTLISFLSWDFSFVMRTYSLIEIRRGRPSVREERYATPPTAWISFESVSYSETVTISTAFPESESLHIPLKMRLWESRLKSESWSALLASSSES